MNRKNIQHIVIKSTKNSDIIFPQENYVAGFPPYIRGINSMMYLKNPIDFLTDDDLSKKDIISVKEIFESIEEELAELFQNGLKLINSNLKKGEKIDAIVSNLCFSITINQNHIQQIAKIRAMRFIWSKIVQEFNTQKTESMALKIHCNFPNNSKSHIDFTLNSLTFLLSGSQSTNYNTISIDAIKHLQNETKITKTIDPFAGSHTLEKQTLEIISDTWKLIKQTL